MTAQAIDDVLAGSFPASDPPGWTPGIARPAPETAARPVDRNTGRDQANGVRADVIDVSRPPDSTRRFARALVSLTGAMGLALLVPVGILAVGTPVALGARGVLELAERLAAIIR
jgi:hypothetical protein